MRRMSLSTYWLLGSLFLGSLTHSVHAQSVPAAPKPISLESRMWTLGLQLHGVGERAPATLTADETDAEDYNNDYGATFGWGAGLTVPLTVSFYEGLGMRFALSASYSGDPLFDQATAQISFLTKTENNGNVTWIEPREYRSREAYFLSTSLSSGIHYSLPLLLSTFKPYIGGGPALYFNVVFTDLEATLEEYAVLENEYNDPYDDFNIDPYSMNVRLGANAYLGVNFKVQNALHLNFEVAYNYAYMPEAPLLKATDGSEARRAAYTYSVIKLSSGLIFNF